MSAPLAGTGPVVLMNVLELDGNPYARLWTAALRSSGARPRQLSRRTVVATGLNRPSWVQIQWPELTLRDPRARAAGRAAARLLLLVTVSRIRGARVMLTAHNVWSHDARHPTLERTLWRLLARLTTDLHLVSAAGGREFLEAHPGLAGARRHVIPIGNYDPVLDGNAPSQAEARQALELPTAGRTFLMFGFLRGYKGTEDVLEAFNDLPDEDARLLIAGRVADPSLAERLDAAQRRDERVIVMARFLGDDELVRLIRASDCVVLPYRRVLNSGSAVLALNLSRCVLLPRTPSFESLKAQVGEKWVSLFSGQLSGSDLASISRHGGDESPDLSWCSWDRIADTLRALWEHGGTA